MKLELATQNDFDEIIAFYDDVTERTPEMATYARWSKGKHPTVEGIRSYIDEGSMYLYRERGAIVGAMAVTMYQSEDYHAIDWSQQIADEKVAVIHILAVSPDAQGKGIGSEMIREAIRLARDKGMLAIRLDALASNTPAHRLYERLGFEYRGEFDEVPYDGQIVKMRTPCYIIGIRKDIRKQIEKSFGDTVHVTFCER